MHYKLRFWDYQFKALIQFHLDEGSEFDVTSVGAQDSTLTIKRLDYDRTNDTDFLRYEARASNGDTVTYVVNNLPTGVEIKLASVQNGQGIYLPTDDPDCEPVMCDCYFVMSQNLRTFWFQ